MAELKGSCQAEGLAEDPKLDWGWRQLRQTGWVNQEGIRHYEVTLEAPNGTLEYNRIVLHFWARAPRSLLSAAVKEKRTAKELIEFLMGGN